MFDIYQKCVQYYIIPVICLIYNPSICYIPIQYTLWLFNIAMENGPFIDGLPIKNGDFPWLC